MSLDSFPFPPLEETAAPTTQEDPFFTQGALDQKTKIMLLYNWRHQIPLLEWLSFSKGYF